MALKRVRDASRASWIVDSGRDWSTLAEQGPPGFESCATVWFDGDVPNHRADTVVLLEALHHLNDDASAPLWFAVWDGWGEAVPYTSRAPGFWDFLWLDVLGAYRVPRLRAPFRKIEAHMTANPQDQPIVFDKPHRGHPDVNLEDARGYYLYRGTLADLEYWAAGKGGAEENQPPAWVWPEDRSWFIASDVDPEWFSVSGSAAAIEQLLEDPTLASAPATYGQFLEDDAKWPGKTQ